MKTFCWRLLALMKTFATKEHVWLHFKCWHFR
jgi:hypothetical protein